MCACSQLCILSFVHLFNGLVEATTPAVILVSAVPRVVLVNLAPVEYLFSRHADWPGGEFAARVSKLDPGDGNMLRTTEASLARFTDLINT